MLSRVFPAVRLFDTANALTAINAAFGVLAICLSHSGHAQLAATLIFLAALLDYLDGHLARTYFSGRDENRAFGKQLDTLADLLNFGVAPAVIIFQTFSDEPIAVPLCVALVLSIVLADSGARLEPVHGHIASCHRIHWPDGTRWVNSYHGYAGKSAPGYEIVAHGEDGVVEWIRGTAPPREGVMWHPERESPPAQTDIEMIKALFSGH